MGEGADLDPSVFEQRPVISVEQIVEFDAGGGGIMRKSHRGVGIHVAIQRVSQKSSICA